MTVENGGAKKDYRRVRRKNKSTPERHKPGPGWADPIAHAKFDKHGICPQCFHPKEQCICQQVRSFDNRMPVVILQHPQEQYKILNSARLAHLALRNSALRVGLSWPSFKALAGSDQIPSQWGVLYLDCGKRQTSAPLTVTDRRRQPLANTGFLKGIVALDGSWKQAKTLWWRNPWLLRLNKICLNPDHPSLRKQVRHGGLSTIEAIAFALENLGEPAQLAESLRTQYEKLVVRPAYESQGRAVDSPASKPADEQGD